jgi:beta-glucanase (GH16 family)
VVSSKSSSPLIAESKLIVSATGQIPNVGPFQLIDRDTPESAYTHTSYETGETWELVFSDEFNNPGRTFWPGGEYSFLRP